MAYGDLTAIKQMLAATGTTWDTADTTRLERLNDAVSLLLEDKLGRRFGTGATTKAVVVESYGVSDLLVLPKPVRSVTSIVVGHTWNGTIWTGGTTLTTNAYRLRYVDANGYAWAILRTSTDAWAGPVVVTGSWADDDDDFLVPADVQYAVNYLVAERFKIENAGPAGFSGPDGAVVPIRDPWKDPMVKGVLEKYGASIEAIVI